MSQKAKNRLAQRALALAAKHGIRKACQIIRAEWADNSDATIWDAVVARAVAS